MRRMSTNPTEYVVFDVETNGLKVKQDDLLSISFYKPDDGKTFNKYLPLERASRVFTTHINGITENDLASATALTQDEFDYIVDEFELEKRTILIYSGRNFDATFLSEYMRRHRISGFERLNFYNIKKNVISSKYSLGNITKDNLCSLFEIDGVETVHSGLHDCELEWKLFEKMDGYYYLVTEGAGEDNVFRLNEDYIIPASLFVTHPNLSRLVNDRHYIECTSVLVKTFEIDAKGIEKFPTNISGMTIEHLLNSMLDVNMQNSQPFLLKNKMQLDYIGKIPNGKTIVPIMYNPDGTVTAIQNKDKEMVKRINSTAENLKERIQPLVDFIKHNIFKDERIMSQELVIDYKHNILALCDLSTEKAILEIKTTPADSLTYKEQFFYEAKGRDIYHLKMEWVKDWNTNLLQKVVFRIFSVDAHIGTPGASSWIEGKREEKRAERITQIRKYLSGSDISLLSFINTGSPIKLQCTICEHEWTIRYPTLMKRIPDCPICKSNKADGNKIVFSEEDLAKLRAANYFEKVLEKSNRSIVAVNYTGAKDDVDAICVACGYKWKSRADHLLDRCWCPVCKRKNMYTSTPTINK